MKHKTQIFQNRKRETVLSVEAQNLIKNTYLVNELGEVNIDEKILMLCYVENQSAGIEQFLNEGFVC